MTEPWLITDMTPHAVSLDMWPGLHPGTGVVSVTRTDSEHTHRVRYQPWPPMTTHGEVRAWQCPDCPHRVVAVDGCWPSSDKHLHRADDVTTEVNWVPL